MTGSNKISVRPEPVEGFKRKSGSRYKNRYGSPINRDFVPFYGTQHSACIHLLLSAHPDLVE